MINYDIFIYFNIRAGISYYLRGFAAWPAPTFKCRYRTACCNSVQKHTASVSFTSFNSFTSAVFGHRSFKQ